MEFFLYFLIYSFLGFILEVLFTRVTGGAKRDRKCMFLLPLCPVYGLGALLILLLPPWVLSRPVPLFFAGAAAATGAEYFIHWFYERSFGVQFWNYSASRWNLHGRVCLLFTAFWGLLAVGLVRFVHPALAAFAGTFPVGVTAALVLLFCADSALTAVVLRATGSTSSLRWYDRFLTKERGRA